MICYSSLLRRGRNAIMPKFVRWILVIVFTILLLLVGTSAIAGIVVYPSRIEVSISPGESQAVELNVANTSINPLKSVVRPWDFARDEHGEAHPIGPEDVKTFRGCSRWLDFESKSAKIPPGEEGTFKFTVTVPKDTQTGTHYCYVTVASTSILSKEAEREKEERGITVPMTYRISALLLVTVGGEEGKRKDSVPTLKRSASLRDFMVNPVNLTESVSLNTEIENSGNSHLILAKGSKIEIWQGKAKEATIPVQEYTLLPEDTLVVPASWKADSPFGKYKAKFYGYVGLNKPLTAEKTFWVISWKLLTAIVSGITVVVVGIIIFFKKFKIQLTPKSAPKS